MTNTLDQEKRGRSAIRNAGCFSCGKRKHITLHHVIAQSQLKGVLHSNPSIWDPRNLVGACEPCHRAVEASVIPIRHSDLPDGFWEFVDEYRLHRWVPWYLREASSTATSESENTDG